MLAYQQLLAETNEYGIPYEAAMDPKNAFKFVSKVETDFSAQTIAADQAAYYKQYDIDPKHPLNRGGHRWSVRLNE